MSALALAGCDGDGGDGGMDDAAATDTGGDGAEQGDGADGVDAGDDGGGVPAGCEAGKVAAEGDIDGVGRTVSGALMARVVLQVGDPASFDVSGAGDIAWHFEWSGGPQPNGTPFDVTGYMDIEGTEHCFSGTLTLDADGWDLFEIGGFATRDGEMCGDAVDGSLTGCADAS